MIELRYVKVPLMTDEHGVVTDDHGVAVMQRKLQYRMWLIRIDASGAITPLPLPIEWTHWLDVEGPA